MVLKLFTILIVVEHQLLPSWLHPNIRLSPGVFVPVFIEYSGEGGGGCKGTSVVNVSIFVISYKITSNQSWTNISTQCHVFPKT